VCRLQDKLNDIKLTLLNDDYAPLHLKVGMIVSVRNKDRDIPLQGTIAYIGQPAFASRYWVGLVLSESLGKNDGSVQSTQYFKCSPKHGLFEMENIDYTSLITEWEVGKGLQRQEQRES